MESRRFFGCYLLRSVNPRFKGRTYIGFTVNPARRLRQHNGEITSGAFRTKKKRPWQMMLCIHGFSTQIEALQFEWAWQHPKKSLAVRDEIQKMKGLRGVAGKIKIAYAMLSAPKWNSMKLTVQFFSSEHSKLKGCHPLPDHMKTVIAPMDQLPDYANRFEDDEREEHGGSDSDVSDSPIDPEAASDEMSSEVLHEPAYCEKQGRSHEVMTQPNVAGEREDARARGRKSNKELGPSCARQVFMSNAQKQDGRNPRTRKSKRSKETDRTDKNGNFDSSLVEAKASGRSSLHNLVEVSARDTTEKFTEICSYETAAASQKREPASQVEERSEYKPRSGDSDEKDNDLVEARDFDGTLYYSPFTDLSPPTCSYRGSIDEEGTATRTEDRVTDTPASKRRKTKTRKMDETPSLRLYHDPELPPRTTERTPQLARPPLISLPSHYTISSSPCTPATSQRQRSFLSPCRRFPDEAIQSSVKKTPVERLGGTSFCSYIIISPTPLRPRACNREVIDLTDSPI